MNTPTMLILRAAAELLLQNWHRTGTVRTVYKFQDMGTVKVLEYTENIFREIRFDRRARRLKP